MSVPKRRRLEQKYSMLPAVLGLRCSVGFAIDCAGAAVNEEPSVQPDAADSVIAGVRSVPMPQECFASATEMSWLQYTCCLTPTA